MLEGSIIRVSEKKYISDEMWRPATVKRERGEEESHAPWLGSDKGVFSSREQQADIWTNEGGKDEGLHRKSENANGGFWSTSKKREEEEKEKHE